MSKKESGLGNLVAGLCLGVGLGMLLAPKSGQETREDLKAKMDDFLDKAKDMKAKDVKDALEKKIEEIKNDLKELDKEVVMAKIKDGTKKIKEKADELVEYATNKGTPIIENAAKEVRTSTVKTLENITAKLKEKDEPKKVNKAKKKEEA